MKNYSDLDESARDLLREMGNIGTGNAVTSLAQMMGCQVDISLEHRKVSEAL